jgi:hypothetical protein
MPGSFTGKQPVMSILRPSGCSWQCHNCWSVHQFLLVCKLVVVQNLFSPNRVKIESHGALDTEKFASCMCK